MSDVTNYGKEMKSFSRDEVPEHFRESFILSGYRHPHSSLKNCIFSMFQVTNETMNIWTHLVPAVYFGWSAVNMWLQMDLGKDPHTLPLMIYMSTMCAFPIASTMAHLFNVMSDHARHMCFFVDYWALSLYGIGSAIAFKAYSFPTSMLDSSYRRCYVPGAALVAVASLVLSCNTRFMDDGARRKIIRFTAFAVPYLYDVAPLILRLCQPDGTSIMPADYFHTQQFFSAFLSAFLYCSHIPERFFPGKFDILCHSHQLFHVISAIGSYQELLALMHDSSSRRSLISVVPMTSSSSNSDIPFPYGIEMFSLAFVFIIDSFVIVYFAIKLDGSLASQLSRCEDHSSLVDELGNSDSALCSATNGQVDKKEN